MYSTTKDTDVIRGTVYFALSNKYKFKNGSYKMKSETENDILYDKKLDIIHIQKVDSTNSFLKRRIQEGTLTSFTVLTADEQTHGRGRLGRIWCNTAGALLMSVAFPASNIEGEYLPMLTPTAALSICDAVENFGIRAEIKWPNDLIVEGKKFCGILTELAFSPYNIPFAIIGIGMNVNARNISVEFMKPAVSLRITYEKDFDINALAISITKMLHKNISLFKAGGKEKIIRRYVSSCKTLGKCVCIADSSGESYEAFAESIDDIGRLIINRNGRKITLDAADVSVKRL